MKILFLSQWFPYPTDNGAKIRVYNLLRGLARDHEITLASFATGGSANGGSSALRAFCREVHVVPWRLFKPRSVRAILGYFRIKPRYVIDTFSQEMKALIERLLSEGNYNLVIASEMGMAGYAGSFQGISSLFEELEQGVFYQQYANATSPVRRMRHGLTWLKQRRYTAGLLPYFKAVTVVSEVERDLLRRVSPGFGTVEVIPNCINLADYAGVDVEPRPNTLVFTGSITFSPNAEAMQWFLCHVYPKVAASVPDIRLSITGDASGGALPAAEGVTLTGYVKDIRPLVASAWASLAPIRTGGGTRLKILEAMALKTPVIATSKGAEGLDVHPGEDILIADTPEEFAQAVICLLKDPSLRQELSANAYQLVRQKYDWAVVMPRFTSLVETMI